MRVGLRMADQIASNIPFRFKENSSSHLDFEIPDYVQKRLEHYGLAFKIENGHTKIIYPAQQWPRKS